MIYKILQLISVILSITAVGIQGLYASKHLCLSWILFILGNLLGVPIYINSKLYGFLLVNFVFMFVDMYGIWKHYL